MSLTTRSTRTGTRDSPSAPSGTLVQRVLAHTNKARFASSDALPFRSRLLASHPIDATRPPLTKPSARVRPQSAIQDP
jgi:hypothetical protein